VKHWHTLKSRNPPKHVSAFYYQISFAKEIYIYQVSFAQEIYMHMHLFIHKYFYTYMYICNPTERELVCKRGFKFCLCLNWQLGSQQAVSHSDLSVRLGGYWYGHIRIYLHANMYVYIHIVYTLIFLAFISENSNLKPLLEGRFAQIHIDLSWRVSGRNLSGDLRRTQIC